MSVIYPKNKIKLNSILGVEFNFATIKWFQPVCVYRGVYSVAQVTVAVMKKPREKGTRNRKICKNYTRKIRT